ncbi:MAG TPA: hypothetical protein VF988_13850 [Verrucomicrobiae bacterium]
MSAFSEPRFAWEPVTPRGVAAFARASFERLFVVQALIALLAAAAVVWVLSDGVYPTIQTAISQLPESGQIHGGKLEWRDDSPVLLAEGRILAISVDLEHGGSLRSPADFQFEFGMDSVRVFSIFGEAEWPYPPGYVIAANQTDARPAWGAWAPDILGLAAIGTFFGLLLTWAVLATLYCLPVWLICLFSNRDLGFAASWRVAGAALMPGALLLSFSLMLYDWGAFDLVQLCFAFGMHLVFGWIYLFVSPLFLKRVSSTAKKNPFMAKTGEETKTGEKP